MSSSVLAVELDEDTRLAMAVGIAKDIVDRKIRRSLLRDLAAASQKEVDEFLNDFWQAMAKYGG